MQKLKQLILEELGVIHWRWQFARLLTWPFPIHAGNRVRVAIFRFIGFPIGHGTLIQGMPIIFGPGKWEQRLIIGEYCVLSIRISLDLAAPITIGDHVHIGPQTMLVTGGHELGDSSCRSGKPLREPIHLGNGAWLGTRCTILPGVTVGEGAIVAAGSVVTKNVPPNTLVAGVPAVIKKKLEETDH